MRRWIAIRIAGLAALSVIFARAPLAAQSLPETVEAIEKARVTTRILFITAHPDDETSALLTYLSRGLSADAALLTLTRGQGGQNAIGPEQGAQLGMLRTEELLAASRHNGVQQFFTRAPDFGFSKSAEQTLKIWGDLPLEDVVRVIRTFRPQIVINGWGGVHSGHGQHQASGILTPQAVAAAADPGKFPEQIQEGLAAWKVSLVLEDRREEVAGGFRLPLDEISPLWGKSYNEMGRESLAFHRSQGVTAFLDSPFFRRPLYFIVESGSGEGAALNNSVLAARLPSLAERFPAFREKMAPGLARADGAIESARAAALNLNWAEAARGLARAGGEIIGVEKALGSLAGASEERVARPGPPIGEALWELRKTSERLDRALADVVALHLEARADRNELVAGDTFTVRVNGDRRADIDLKSIRTSLEVPEGWQAVAEGDRYSVHIPANARRVGAPGDVILPWPPSLVRVRFEADLNGYSFTAQAPAEAIRATSTRVDPYPLELVPAVTLTLEPRRVVLPEKPMSGVADNPIELLARVRYHGTGQAKVFAGLDVPGGWNVAPIEPLDFSGAGDQLVRFTVTPPAHPRAGAYALTASARVGEKAFRTSLEPLPSLATRNWSEPAGATVDVLELTVPPDLRIGFITAGNDPIPDTLRQLGIQVDLLDEVALAFGDLGRHDAIVVGIRGYELRPDLPRANPRLLNYVEQGGTLIVQYQRDFAWAKLLPAPFPAAMGQPAARVTDPNSPVRFLTPDSPLLNFPNKITLDDFKGWFQERGLYFWGQFDPHYQAVLGLRDPGEQEMTGSLVSARDGKGVYIYTGLSFFRELPAGVPGAYRLFVNLLSQSRLSPRKD